jgi:uncharacterized membrane protein YGL010W
MGVSIFDVNKQMTFYGAYHSNRINVLVHIIFVPVLLWTFQVMGCYIPLADSIKSTIGSVAALANGGTVPAWLFHYRFNEWMVWDLNATSLVMVLYWSYYFILEPLGAILYAPQLALSTLTALSYSYGGTDALKKAAILNGASWVAQFLSHGIAEGRAPALLDNIVGALVLAPFFVHLEILFALGYKPEMHKRLQNEIGKEIVKVRKGEGDKRRAKEAGGKVK